ncbi:prolipoprotein diacylglyceryl transferase [Woodsholea maritima]|uniref:prolipoprotein diacylglyceryl transferase n=1 Tax=Woodsholea maritima TaxID=240237 RepID=UPI000377D7BF|nr:prolipoprotein diacylglyceryl transferase [Woodsholea maritima]
MDYCQPTFDLIKPILFTFGPFDLFGHEISLPIRWYALAYIFGLVIAWQYMTQLAKRPALWSVSDKNAGSPYTPAHAEDLFFWGMIGVIVGGRLGYVLFYQTSAIWERPAWIITGITEGGMSFHGGFIGVATVLVLMARRHSIALLRLTDAAAVVTPVGLMLGRLANFINGELWGRAAPDLPWAMRFASDPYCLERHPSQLYEAFGEGFLLLVILGVLTWRFKGLARPGLATGIFVAGYGLVRALLEFVREPDSHMPEFLREYITMGMALSLPMIALGAWLIYRALTNKPVGAKD